MAELQTVSAAFDVAKLAYQGCKFLYKVKQADEIVGDVYNRTVRLKEIIDTVDVVLDAREERGVSAKGKAELRIEKNIEDCVQASHKALLEIQDKVGGFKLLKNPASVELVERVKTVLRHPRVNKLQNDLEARISALSADLLILQLSDQAHTHATIRGNNRELLGILEELRKRLDTNNRILRNFQRRHGVTATSAVAADASDELSVDAAAVVSLQCGVQIGEDLYERYTSEYAPDDQSIRFNRGLAREEHLDSPVEAATPEPASEAASESEDDDPPPNQPPAPPNPEHFLFDDDDDSGTMPLEHLDGFILDAIDRAARERDQSHFKQAEHHLQSAIKYSEDRERYYSIPFTEKAKYQEEITRLHQKQGKFAEAIAKAHQLLNVTTDPSAKFRQFQLLASIYFERNQSRHGTAASRDDDLEKAEKCAKRAYVGQYELLKQQDVSDEEVERHDACTELLIRIFEARDKPSEASVLKKIRSEGDSSAASASMRRVSSTRPNSDFVLVGDKQALLIQAIRSGDSDQIDNLLKDDVDIEKRCEHGKTLLLYAVESVDETIVAKLLNPDIGADVNGTDKNGLTVLHHAAASGLLGMVRFLLAHDADIEAKDKRKQTPLFKAVRANEGQVVEELYNHGANLEAKDVEDWSLLHFAVRLREPDLLTRLLDLCPDLKDAVDLAGKTAMHFCAEQELLDNAAALLKHRNHVDIAAVDSCGRSSLYFAASKPPTETREKLVALLVKQGATIDESRPPPRWRDYTSLKEFQLPRRPSKFSRHDSVSTEGSVGTTSTAQTKFSSIFSRRRK